MSNFLFPFLLLFLGLATVNCAAVAGGAGFAASFRGVGEFILAPNVSFDDNAGITIEFWMIASLQSPSFTPFSLVCPNDTQMRISWSGMTDITFMNNVISPGSKSYFEVTDTDFAQWHHYSFTWVNATGLLRVYVDGVLWIESFLANSVGYVINGTCEFYLGQYYPSDGTLIDPARIFVGAIDEVRIWSTFMTAGRIRGNMQWSFGYQQNQLDSVLDLALAWTFDEYFFALNANQSSLDNRANYSVFDSSPNALHGVMGCWSQRQVVVLSRPRFVSAFLANPNMRVIAYTSSRANVINPVVPTVYSVQEDSQIDMIMTWASKVLVFPTFYISSLAGIGFIQLNGTSFPTTGSKNNYCTLTILPTLFFDPALFPARILYTVNESTSGYSSVGQFFIVREYAPSALAFTAILSRREQTLVYFPCFSNTTSFESVQVVLKYVPPKCRVSQVAHIAATTTYVTTTLTSNNSIVSLPSHALVFCCNYSASPEIDPITVEYYCVTTPNRISPSVQSLISTLPPKPQPIAGISPYCLAFNGLQSYGFISSSDSTVLANGTTIYRPIYSSPIQTVGIQLFSNEFYEVANRFHFQPRMVNSVFLCFASASSTLSLQLTQGGDVAVILGSGSRTLFTLAGDDIVEPNTWTQLSFALDSTTGTIMLYKNGINYIPKTVSAAAFQEIQSVLSNVTGIYLGAACNMTSFFDGYLDQLVIWNSVLTISDITDFYTSPQINSNCIQKGTNCPTNLLSVWAMNEGSGNYAFDVVQQEYSCELTFTDWTSTNSPALFTVPSTGSPSSPPPPSTSTERSTASSTIHYTTPQDTDLPVKLYGSDDEVFIITKLPSYGQLIQRDCYLANCTSSPNWQVMKEFKQASSHTFISQWVSSAVEASSQYSTVVDNVVVSYSKDSIVGPITYETYWSPLGLCNQVDGVPANDYIEFLVDEFVFPYFILIYENSAHPLTIAVYAYKYSTSTWLRVDNSLYSTIDQNYSDYESRVVLNSFYTLRGEGGLKYSPPLCAIPVKTNRFKVVVDSCLRPGRKGIYAIQVRGSKDARAGVVIDPNQVYYRPHQQGLDLVDEFQYNLYTCSELFVSSPYTIPILTTEVFPSPTVSEIATVGTAAKGMYISLNGTVTRVARNGTVLTLDYIIVALPMYGNLFAVGYTGSSPDTRKRQSNSSEFFDDPDDVFVVSTPITNASLPYILPNGSNLVYYVPADETCGTIVSFNYLVSDHKSVSGVSPVTIALNCTAANYAGSRVISYVFFAVSGLAIILAFLAMLWVIIYRRVLVNQKPIFLVIILIGFVACNVYGILDFTPRSDATCYIQVWLLHLGLSTIIFTWFVRTYLMWGESTWILSKKIYSTIPSQLLVFIMWITPMMIIISMLIMYSAYFQPYSYMSYDASSPYISYKFCTQSVELNLSMLLFEFFFVAMNLFFSFLFSQVNKVYIEFVPVLVLFFCDLLLIASRVILIYAGENISWFPYIVCFLFGGLSILCLFAPKMYFFFLHKNQSKKDESFYDIELAERNNELLKESTSNPKMQTNALTVNTINEVQPNPNRDSRVSKDLDDRREVAVDTKADKNKKEREKEEALPVAGEKSVVPLKISHKDLIGSKDKEIKASAEKDVATGDGTRESKAFSEKDRTKGEKDESGVSLHSSLPNVVSRIQLESQLQELTAQLEAKDVSIWELENKLRKKKNTISDLRSRLLNYEAEDYV